MKALVMYVLMMIFFVGCANSQMKKEIKEDKNMVGEIDTRGQMNDRVYQMLHKSDKLTIEQKNKFMKLHSSIIRDVANINNKIRKEKVVLFKSIISEDYNDRKVRVLKKSIKKLHQQKFDLMMDALDQTKDIIGIADKELLMGIMEGHEKIY